MTDRSDGERIRNESKKEIDDYEYSSIVFCPDHCPAGRSDAGLDGHGAVGMAGSVSAGILHACFEGDSWQAGNASTAVSFQHPDLCYSGASVSGDRRVDGQGVGAV